MLRSADDLSVYLSAHGRIHPVPNEFAPALKIVGKITTKTLKSYKISSNELILCFRNNTSTIHKIKILCSIPRSENSKCLNVDRPTTDLTLFLDGRTMIEGFSTDYSTTSSTEEICHRRNKNSNLAR